MEDFPLLSNWIPMTSLLNMTFSKMALKFPTWILETAILEICFSKRRNKVNRAL
jgi:hypothetical protein